MRNALLERVFFSIDPIKWKSIIEMWQKKLMQEISEINQSFHARPSVSTHLTLLFLGEQKTSEIELINHCVSEMTFGSKVLLKAKNIGLLHSHIVIFIEVDRLRDLHEQLIHCIHDVNLSMKKEHSFIPHITLGKIQYPMQIENVMRICSAYNVGELDELKISYFNLYRSYPGSRYEVLQKYRI